MIIYCAIFGLSTANQSIAWNMDYVQEATILTCPVKTNFIGRKTDCIIFF
jgi:hypothetical protein